MSRFQPAPAASGRAGRPRVVLPAGGPPLHLLSPRRASPSHPPRLEPNPVSKPPVSFEGSPDRLAGRKARMRLTTWAAASALVLGASSAMADAPPPERQALGDAWWTGPLLAPSAGTLPQGHLLIEPYLYDSQPYGHFDSHGDRHDVAHENDFGSLTYLNYGLTDEVTVGLIPRFGYRRTRAGTSSSGIGVGDLTVQGQFRLAKFDEARHIPALSVAVGETLPTGKYDRLDGRPNDGFGAGALSTTLSLYSQYFFWTPAGRILRTRLDLSYQVSDRADLSDISVYGTPTGFRGHADPGDSFVADLAFEYSVTRSWVLALDLGYEADASTRVSGRAPGLTGGGPIDYQARSGWSQSFVLAPAVEYNFTSAVGVIAGARIVTGGRNTTALVTPVVAINYVY